MKSLDVVRSLTRVGTCYQIMVELVPVGSCRQPRSWQLRKRVEEEAVDCEEDTVADTTEKHDNDCGEQIWQQKFLHVERRDEDSMSDWGVVCMAVV